MKSKRIYDILGAVIATIVATIIINQFSSFVAWLNSGTTWKIYGIIALTIVVAFLSHILTRLLFRRRQSKSSREKDQKIESLKSEIKQLDTDYKALEELASVDLQTGALNKNQIQRVVQERIENALREGASFCVILADIDGFKRINDTYDHEAGNFVLKQISELIRPRSKDDSLIRYGGDEFLIVTKLGEDVSGGYGFAERIRKEVQSHNLVIDYSITERERITISCGVTAYRGEKDSNADLLERVAQALKVAKSEKENGKAKNFVHVIE